MAATSPHRSRPRISAGLVLPGLVAVLTLMTLELVRSSGPLLDIAYGQGGATGVAGTALLSYLSAGLVAALLLLAVGRGFRGPVQPPVLLVGVVLLAGLRLVAQGLEGDARFAVGLTTVALAVAVLTLAVATLASRGGGRTAASAVFAGAAAGVGLQLALGTWDAYWRHTWLGWSVTVAVVGILVGLAFLAERDPATAPAPAVGRLWVLGPLLALLGMMLANPAFAASQSGIPLAVAGPVQAGGLLLGSWLLMRSGRPANTDGERVRTLCRSDWVEAGMLVIFVAGALSLGGLIAFDGVLVLLALIGAQVVAVRMLSDALDPAPGKTGDDAQRSGVSLRLGGTVSLVGLGTILPLLVYQLDYDVPLGFPNELAIVATAAVVGGAGLRRISAGAARTGATAVGDPGPVRWTLFAASATLVLVGTGVAGAAWFTHRQTTALAGGEQSELGSGKMVSWNLHYGVSPGGSVDLEAMARTIEAQDPDVVLLQEVSRGWVLGGGADMATWLSNRLGQRFVFAPAADRRFGNVIMSRTGLQDVRLHPLPYGDGPQNRSAISAQVRIGERPVTVTSVHLQNRRAYTPTRIRQLESLLADLRLGGRPERAMIIGGDLNAEPGWPEIALMTDVDFVSAVDAVGDAAALTSPSIDPQRRIDWVFGRGVTFSGATVLVDARWSDHLPLVVAVAP